MNSVSLVERWGAGLRDSAWDAPTSSGQAEEDGPVEEMGREGDEQVWVKPARRALPGGRGSQEALFSPRFLEGAAATWILSGQRWASCGGGGRPEWPPSMHCRV